MSITSRSYRPLRCFSQSSRIFWIALLDRGVLPVTYSRSTYRCCELPRSLIAFSKSSARSTIDLPLSISRTSCALHPRGRQFEQGDRASTILGLEVHAHEKLLSVRQVTNDPLQRCRKFSNQRRERENLISRRKLRVLHQVDHLDLVSPREMILAKPLQVGKGRDRFRRLAGDVQSQAVMSVL